MNYKNEKKITILLINLLLPKFSSKIYLLKKMKLCYFHLPLNKFFIWFIFRINILLSPRSFKHDNVTIINIINHISKKITYICLFFSIHVKYVLNILKSSFYASILHVICLGILLHVINKS